MIHVMRPYSSVVVSALSSVLAVLPGCSGDLGGVDGSTDEPTLTDPSREVPRGSPSSPAAPAGVWTLGRSLTKNWDAGAPSWAGGNSVSFDDVEKGATLVLGVYGFTYPAEKFNTPVDSMGQPIELAVDAGTERSVQATAWVLHDAAAGSHTWTQIPDLSTGDGKLFFMEFRHAGAPSSSVLGAASQVVNAYQPPWLTGGSVTMSSGAHAGDLLVAFSFEEEGGVGNPNTGYTDPPDGWFSLGVQNETKLNIGGEACWRVAPDASPQTVSWSWNLAGEQDPSVFKAVIFAVHAP